MASKIELDKAAAMANLQKEIQTAKTPEQKLKACLAAVEMGESLVTSARGAMHDVLLPMEEGTVIEIDGVPHKRAQVRYSGGTDEKGVEKPVRFTLRCAIPKGMLARYDFSKKASKDA